MSDRRAFLRGAAGGGALAALATIRRAFEGDLGRQGAGDDPEPALGRDSYGLEPGLAYLNHASIGTVPKSVQAAHRDYLQVCERFPSLYVWGEPWERAREEVRAKLAALLGCRAGEIAITHNTTEGFNLLAQGLPLGPGDEVLYSELNHDGARVCFEHFGARRGYTARRFSIPVESVSSLGVEEVVALHTEAILPETKLLVLPHIDNRVGLRHPVAAIARAARERGVEYVAVDGAQSLGMIPVDVGELDVDFYSGSPHKWWQAPKGLGVLFVRQALQPELSPMWVTWGQRKWKGTARAYEDYGTRDLPEVLALGAALDFHGRTPWTARTESYRALRELARELARSAELGWFSPETWELGASIYSVHVPRGREVEAELLERRIATRVFGHSTGSLVRLSPNSFNTSAEIERAFATFG